MKKERTYSIEPVVEEIVIGTISSVEVAEMMEMEHSKVLRKIEGINEDLIEAKIGLNSYWTESTYKASNGKTNKCYNITKLGCDFLAHKMQGKKGNIFTARYIQKFEKMKTKLSDGENDFKKLSPTTQAIINIELNQQEQAKQIETVKNEVTDLKENAPLYNVECDRLQKTVRKVAIKVLGGANSYAYKNKPTRTKVYIDVQNELKRQFGTDSYKAIKRKYFEDALEILEEYIPPKYLKDEITLVNNQLEIDS